MNARQIVNELLELGGNQEADRFKYVPAPEGTENIDPDELDMGRKEEMEHTNDPTEAEAIAMDHLRTEPHYYSKLKAAGLAESRCSGCEVAYVNGVKTHEHGCPEAWKDYKVECKWCGTEFKPETKFQEFCSDECAEAYNG